MIDWRLKGFPPDATAIKTDDVARQEWNIHRDFTTPIAVLDAAMLERNITLMQAFCAAHGVRIAPHGKTTMSPELIAMQMAAGAWGVTAATAWQARRMLEFGAKRVLIANEVVDAVELRWIQRALASDPDLDLLVYVDSIAGLLRMQRILSASGAPARPVPVIIELGSVGARTGLREDRNAARIADAIASSMHLELVGVGGFEGVVAADRSPASIDAVRSFLRRIRSTARHLIAQGAFRSDRPVVVTAGGSVYFDVVADELANDGEQYGAPVEVVLRSGCYLVHDHGIYSELSPWGGPNGLQPALSVWATVLSVPEPGFAVVDVGKRDISTEAPVPILGVLRDGVKLEAEGVSIARFNDQHGQVEFEKAGTLRVGDRVQLGTSHPCVTFDKWRAMPVVHGDGAVSSVARMEF